MTENWYKARLRERYNDPAVKEAVLNLLDGHGIDGDCELMPAVEEEAFGPRVECPHGCGSMNLPGAPECFGCEEKI